jgi:hypothetical protein
MLAPMRTIPLALACLSFAACPKIDDGSFSDMNMNSAGSSGGGACSPLDGIYHFSYSLRSGTCGPQPDELLEFRNGRSFISPSLNCQPGGEAMTGACTLERDSMCAVSDPATGLLLGHVHVSGVLTEVNDNTRVQGTLAVASIDTNGASCDGSYDAVGVKTR